MAHSVENRFIAIISGALLVIVAPLFTLFLFLSSQEAGRGMKEHISILLVANSQALGKPLWDLDVESIAQIAGTLVSDPAIYKVTVLDTTSQLDITQTARERPSGELDAVSQRITYKTVDGLRDVGSITVYFRKIDMLSGLSQMEVAFTSIFILAIITVFGASIIGNRLMIIKPLLRLTAAIEATRRLGSRHHVDWRSNDEMGRLARSFNEMQTQLEREENEIKRAHKQTTEIYNLTPAMLFSLDAADRITAVSDYWLAATGYKRENVFGRKFIELVDPEDHELYSTRKSNGHLGAGTCEVTVRFLRADGGLMDVLILESELAATGVRHTASLNVMTDVTELRQSEQRNHQQAISDHLTGLLNRQGFEAALHARIAEADASGTELACLFVDLDRFKAINDNHGHAIGDAVLREFVERLGPLIRPEDTASRLGGDEFSILLAGEGSAERAVALCDRIVQIFDTPFSCGKTIVRLSASVGLALYPRHASTAAELLQKSDMAMYARKRDGKNGAQIYDPVILDQTRERAEIEHRIEEALAEDWFEAYFQPVINLDDRKIVGFEALMRLNHPQKGILPPAGIIAVAEETGSIGQIGNVILEKALSNLARLSHLPGMAETYAAVNFSALQFEPGLPIRLAALLARYDIHPSRLVLEITEAVIMNDNPEIRTTLNEINRYGCRIALDDFGTGYSSLSYLNRFPVDIVKIDQSFTRSINDPVPEVSRRSRMLVEGIAAISHKMNCVVIAEGVETADQSPLLQKMGVDCGQGYLFAKPQKIEHLMASLSEREMETIAS